MLSFSVKSHYGLIAIFALAQMPEGTPLQSKQIAERYTIPQAYLEQLMLTMKKGGIVKSIRGCHGGYILAKPAQLLHVCDIVECLEGASILWDRKNSPLATFWETKNTEIRALFSVSIADLIKMEQKQHQILAYSI